VVLCAGGLDEAPPSPDQAVRLVGAGEQCRPWQIGQRAMVCSRLPLEGPRGGDLAIASSILDVLQGGGSLVPISSMVWWALNSRCVLWPPRGLLDFKKSLEQATAVAGHVARKLAAAAGLCVTRVLGIKAGLTCWCC